MEKKTLKEVRFNLALENRITFGSKRQRNIRKNCNEKSPLITPPGQGGSEEEESSSDTGVSCPGIYVSMKV